MNVATAAKAGRTRAAIHTNSGQNEAIASSSVHGAFGRMTRSKHSVATMASANIPSTISRLGGTLRKNEASPIISGATVMLPSVSVTAQWRHIVVTDEAVG